MLFNSIDFAVFLPIVFLLHWSVRSSGAAWQNVVLILSGAVFYGWWDPRYLGLLLLTSGIDWFVAMGLERSRGTTARRGLLAISLLTNLGLLGFFKYYDFFAQGFADAFSLLGHRPDVRLLHLVLPVGISFYTFQSLSYTIDVYRKELKAVHDPLVFFAFVGFFPQLLAGPIERARNMLGQFERPRAFDGSAAVDGIRQMLWGLFKKVVIADQCAPLVDEVFDTPSGMPAARLMVGCVLFSFQIYCDFSGYSDIAIGCARLFGITLMRNFAYPYFARDIAEFWRRWHISLSTWFRDYLYIPLGGNRGSTGRRIRNICIIFLVSGLWHGANYTFIVWGALHALLFLPLLLRGTNRTNTGDPAAGRLLPTPSELAAMVLTFALVTLAWVFFRARDIEHAVQVLSGILGGVYHAPGQLLAAAGEWSTTPVAWSIAFMLVIEWLQRDQQHALARLERFLAPTFRWVSYYALLLVVLYFSGEEQAFIYFQF